MWIVQQALHPASHCFLSCLSSWGEPLLPWHPPHTGDGTSTLLLNDLLADSLLVRLARSVEMQGYLNPVMYPGLLFFPHRAVQPATLPPKWEQVPPLIIYFIECYVFFPLVGQVSWDWGNLILNGEKPICIHLVPFLFFSHYFKPSLCWQFSVGWRITARINSCHWFGKRDFSMSLWRQKILI